jgi:hypothetical protein
MLGVAGVFGGSLFSAMHGSLVTSSLIRETTENESANEGYRFGYNCFPLIFTQKYSNRFQWRVVVKHSDLGLRRRQQQEAAKPVSNSLWVVSLVS